MRNGILAFVLSVTIICLLAEVSRENRKILALTNLLLVHENRNTVMKVACDPLTVNYNPQYSSHFDESLLIASQYRLTPKEVVLEMPVVPDLLNSIENTYGQMRPGGRYHEGIDLFVPAGTPISSATDGLILFAGRDFFGGNVVKVFGVDNRIYYYAHLSCYVSLATGSEVRMGEIIGFVGNSGNAVLTPPPPSF